MAIKTPVKATFSGGNVVGLAEFTSSDFIGVAAGGIGTTSLTSNSILLGNGSDAVQSSSIQIVGTTLSSSDSSTININEGLVVEGNLNVTGTIAGTLTSATGLPISTGVSGLGTGVATFLATPSSANLASAVTDETGTGALVFANSPTLVTPTLGVATATSVNKLSITAPATSATLTIADGKTLTASNTLTLTGTDSSSIAFGTGGTVAYTSNKLSVFAATTSSELAGVISDETGTGSLVFASSPTLITPALGTPSSVTLTNATGLPISTGVSGLGTGVATFLATPSSSNFASMITDETGTGSVVLSASPTFTGTANFAAISTTGNVTVGGNLTVQGTTTTVNSTTIEITNSFTFEGATADAYETTLGVIDPTADRTINLPNLDGTVALTANKLSVFAATTSSELAGVISDETGSGALVFANSPTLITPALGTPSSVTLTNATGLPISGLTSSTTTALGVGSIELGHATDTTIARSSAGVITVEGVVVPTVSSTDTLTNKTLTAPIIATISNTGTLTLPTSTDTLVGRATTDTLTNKTLTSPKINENVAVTATATQLNYTVGVTSAIQTQLDAKSTKAFAIAQAVALG